MIDLNKPQINAANFSVKSLTSQFYANKTNPYYVLPLPVNTWNGAFTNVHINYKSGAIQIPQLNLSLIHI